MKSFDEIVRNLSNAIDKYKDKMVGVGEVRIDYMAEDCLAFIKEQQKEIERLKVDRDQWKRVAEASRDVIQPKLRTEIEELKAKQARWIAVSERLPSKEECGEYGRTFLCTVDANGLKNIPMTFVYETVRGKEVCRWKWQDRLSPWYVIAWQPLPEPYRGKKNE